MLLTTYFDAPCGSDYEGDAWVGNSHESDGAGIARHCLPWGEKICAEHGLAAADLGRGDEAHRLGDLLRVADRLDSCA